jgi:geranylgeranyl diphosphate synthase type I
VIQLAGTPDLAFSLTRLMPGEDRARIDARLTRVFDQTRRRYACNPQVAPLVEEALKFTLEGGKRIRPRLCLAAYRILTQRFEPPPAPVWNVAVVLEALHAFMLVHDDLMDQSLTRRDRPTLHERYREGLNVSARTAGDLGIVAGDWMFALAIRMLGRAGLQGARLARVVRIIAEMLIETGLGQSLDLLHDGRSLESITEEDITTLYRWKTARYTVSGPLVLGAALANAPAATRRCLNRFGDLLGFGYQICNDLESLEDDLERGDHADLDTGKRTYVLWTAHRVLDPLGRAALAQALEAPVGLERRRRLRDLIVRSGAVALCRQRVRDLRNEAVELLQEAPLTVAQRQDFLALAQLFTDMGSAAS